MKKTLNTLLVMAVAAMGFVACDDDEDDDKILSTTPAKEVVGTYSGTFTVVASGDTTFQSGTVVLEEVSDYVCNVTVNSESLGTCSDVANVVLSQKGYIIYNYTNATIGSAGFNFFYSAEEGMRTGSSFTKVVRSGRSEKTTYFSFTGTKD